jgi:hypothetical protein
MTTLSSITRLPYVAPAKKGETIDSIAGSRMAPISTALPVLTDIPDRILALSRKLARQSREQCRAMDGCRGDGLDGNA